MIFLTSTGFLNPEVFNILIKNRTSVYQNATIICTGLPGKKDHPIAKNSLKILSENGIKKINLLDIEYEDPSVISDCELVFIAGGNSAHLFYHLKRSGTAGYILSHVSSGKDIVGASAGAWYLSSGRGYADYFTFLKIDESYPYPIDSTGLKLIEMDIFPHYDMFCDRVEDLELKLAELEKENNIKFIRLNNMDFIYKDNLGEIHTVRKEEF